MLSLFRILLTLINLDSAGERPVRPKLLVTRSLEEIYNVGCVIRAFKKVHDYFPESSLGIVGDGSQRQALEKLVARSSI